MTTVDEKEILEIEKLKQDLQLDMKKFDLELQKINYDGKRLLIYGIVVGAGGVFAVAKTLQIFMS
jgi:hypothetical protein